MRTRQIEVIVGVVTLVALAVLIGVTVNLKKSTIFSHKEAVYAYFKDVKRLGTGAPVYVYGVVRGEVSKIESTGYTSYTVRVTMRVKLGPDLHRGAQPRVVSAGLMGETEISIDDINPRAPQLEKHDVLYGIPTMDINEVLARAPAVIAGIQDAVASLSEILADEKNRKAFTDLLESGSSIAVRINQALGTSSSDITESIRNIRSATDRFNQLMTHADLTLTTFGRDLSQAGSRLNLTIDELRTSAGVLVNRLDTVARRINATTDEASRLLATAESILKENRQDVRRAIGGATSTTVHLGAILTRIDKGETLGEVLIGPKAFTDLTYSLARLKESADSLQKLIEGLNRWLTGAVADRHQMEIPYEGVAPSTGTAPAQRPATRKP